MKKQSLALACALASLVAACGGGSSPSSQSPSFAAMIGSASGGGADVAATGTRWQSVKYGGGGYVPGLIFHPTSPNVLYARTDIGGVYRWDATASTWVAVGPSTHEISIDAPPLYVSERTLNLTPGKLFLSCVRMSLAVSAHVRYRGDWYG